MDTGSVASVSAGERWRQFLLFARNFLRSPLAIGTLLPSSQALVDRVAAQVDWSRARVVVEYGAGLGTISTALLERLPSGGRQPLVETNAEFAGWLVQNLRDHRVVVAHASAADVAELVEAHDLGAVDAVVSGIPFSTLPPAVRETVLRATRAVLRPGGQFVVYQYSRAVLRHLGRRFAVIRTLTEWRNAWPARIFVCRPQGGVDVPRSGDDPSGPSSAITRG